MFYEKNKNYTFWLCFGSNTYRTHTEYFRKKIKKKDGEHELKKSNLNFWTVRILQTMTLKPNLKIMRLELTS